MKTPHLKFRLLSLFQAFFSCVLIIVTSHSHALTATDLMGDWVLTSFRLTYPGYGVTLTQADFTSYAGRASLSGAAGTVELRGTYQGILYWQWGTGFYVVSGDCATFSVIGGASDTICFQKQGNNSIVATGDTLDPYGDYYQYRYVFRKTKTYYTQSQLNQAIAAATSGTYTQSELNAAISAATANLFSQDELDRAIDDAISDVNPRVVPIILTD